MQLRTVGLQRFSGTLWELSRMLGADLIVLLTATLTLVLRACASEPPNAQPAALDAPTAPSASANANANAAPTPSVPDGTATQTDARISTFRRERAPSGIEGRAQIPSFMSVEARRQLLLRFQLASTCF